METDERLRRRKGAVKKIEVALDRAKTFSDSSAPARHIAEAVTELARMEVASLLAAILERAGDEPPSPGIPQESFRDVYSLAAELLPEFGQERP